MTDAMKLNEGFQRKRLTQPKQLVGILEKWDPWDATLPS